MNRINFFGLSALTASFLFSGCSETPDQDSIANIDSIVRNSYYNNGEQLNGQKLNGQKLNGQKLNGQKLNGTATNSVSVVPDGGTLVGFVIETGAVLRGPNFHPVSLTAILEDGSEGQVKVIDYKTISVAGLVDMDYYMVVNASDGQSICGNDDAGQPIWSLPLTRTFDQINGKPGSRVDLFSFNCYGGALEKCNRYGYPDWLQRFENPGKWRDLDAYHDACVNMVRADYCGDGQTHTFNGTSIDIYDNLGFNTPDNSSTGVGGWYREAEWDADGAWCINHTRWMPNTLAKTIAANNSASNPDWAYIQAHCPERIAGNPWPGNPAGGSAPRACDTSSNYNAATGYNMTNQRARGLLRLNTPLYQY